MIVDAVRKYKEVNPNIQLLSINAGFGESKKLDLMHHIGMEEKDAGYLVGKSMVKMAVYNRAYCVTHNPELPILVDRCAGFEQSMNEINIQYMGQIHVLLDSTTDPDYIAGYLSMVEIFVGESSGWEGYGFLMTGASHLPAALELKRLHKNLVLGTFDTNDLLCEALDAGNVLFGIDQQPYLQGYSPIQFLTHAATTRQSFRDHAIKSGPSFVTTPPTDEEAGCEARNFPICGKGRSIILPSLFQQGRCGHHHQCNQHHIQQLGLHPQSSHRSLHHLIKGHLLKNCVDERARSVWADQ